jgi:hypothetical protein
MPTKEQRNKRSKYFVDPQVQGTLLRQAVLYWLWTTVTFGLVILFCRVAPSWLSGTTHPSGRVWYHLGPYVFASALLLPIVFFHAIRFSNRFAGPMVRVRRTLRELTHGESPRELRFRENDFWTDVADEINELSAAISQLRSSDSNSTETPAHDKTVCTVEDASAQENSNQLQSLR